jgi:ribonuclease BN (tRNA processing enzyme)
MATGVRVRLLGTGGAANERRHQACLLVEHAESRVLLDTGSGLEVVRRLLAVDCDPCRVQDVFVSHQHADHAGGLEPLLLWSILTSLQDRGCPPREETRIHAEPRILAALDRMFAAVATVVPRLFGDRLRFVPAAHGAPTPLAGGARLVPFLVDHEPVDGGAMGCVVEVGGVRLVYSGDTRPTAHLERVARDADVLFHEAGGLDSYGEVVRRYGHATAGDAGRAAKAAGVGRLVLVHLPADHLAEAMLAEAADAFGGPVGVASDLDVIEV